MPHFFLLLAALILSWPLPALGDDYDVCASYPDVPVQVIPRFDAPVYDYSRDIGAITALSSDTRRSIHENLALGLTQYEPILELKAPLVAIRRSDGLTCAHVERVEVTVGYQDVKVFIAREFPQGTCGFDEIMAHEQKHIAVNMAVLQDYAPRIEAELSNYLRTEGVRQETDMNYAMQLIKEKMHTIIQSIMTEMSDDNTQRQRAVDSPEEYARIGAACGGQMRLAVARFIRYRE